ncbi:M55 family metallopeptidase [candidate division KSB1 bacterium]
MKKIILIVTLLCVTTAPAFMQRTDDLKVFISVDMEGLAGVVVGDEVSSTGRDYGMTRRIMAAETNAAIEGAAAAGATEIIVRDGHGSKTNIIPETLDRRAKLLRGLSSGPENMMESIDGTYDAVIFIGYHAKAGTPDAILDHTSTGNVMDFSINGVSIPEAGYNALAAGLYDVPVAFVAGDKAICEQVRALFGDVETVETKVGIGAASLGLHPAEVNDRIRAGVEKALRDLRRFRPYKMSPPYTMVLKMKNEEKVYDGQFFPGAERTGDWEITYTSSNLLDVLHAFNKIK